VFARGPEFVAGQRIAGATVYDVAPTVLRLAGFPVAEDMPGDSLEHYLTEQYTSTHPLPPRVASYGVREADSRPLVADKDTEREVERRLKDLGYL
jgi:hypothetical protein